MLLTSLNTPFTKQWFFKQQGYQLLSASEHDKKLLHVSGPGWRLRKPDIGRYQGPKSGHGLKNGIPDTTIFKRDPY